MYNIGDFILRIKNAYNARLKEVTMPYSNVNKQIAAVLVKEGFLAKIEEEENDKKRVLRAYLRYENRKPALHNVKLISKPSVRVYVDSSIVSMDKDRLSTSIISTSSGILTGREARKKGIGGELLFKIW